MMRTALCRMAAVCLALLLSLALAAQADTMQDWFGQVWDAYEENAGEDQGGAPEAALAQTAVPPPSPGSGETVNAYVQNRILATGPVQAADGFEFIVSAAQGYAVITKYTGTAEEPAIPAALGGLPVEYIGDAAFAYCYSLRAVTLPDTVQGMGNNVFYACVNLAEAALPPGVTDTGAGLFANCRALKGVSLPAGLTGVKVSMFEQCISLETIAIPAGTASIGELAFHNCLALKEALVPQGVLYIADDAFSLCPQLVLRAAAGSYAHQYAVSKGISFAAMP